MDDVCGLLDIDNLSGHHREGQVRKDTGITGVWIAQTSKAPSMVSLQIQSTLGI